MKKIILNKRTVSGFTGVLVKLLKISTNVVFSETGLKVVGSKFGKLRSLSSLKPFEVSAQRISFTPAQDGVIIEGMAIKVGFLSRKAECHDMIIPFGKITFAYNSFFWIDQNGFWRQMKFSGSSKNHKQVRVRIRSFLNSPELIGTGHYCPECHGLCGNSNHTARQW